MGAVAERRFEPPVVSNVLDHVLTAQPGRPVELSGPAGFGLTRLGYRMLAEPSRSAPVAVIDARGWMSPLSAWEVGVVPEHLIVVRCEAPELWSKVTAALCEGIRAVYAEVPPGLKDQALRRLVALARARRMRLVLRSFDRALPSGVVFLHLRAVEVHWDGADRGHGRLGRRQLVLEASGKGVAGMRRRIEVEDSGADLVCVAPELAAWPNRRAVM